MNRKLYLFRAWMHDYFHHPLPNIRTADPIVPRRLYLNFGNLCVCEPHSPAEARHLRKWGPHALPLPLLLQALHSPSPMDEIDMMYDKLSNKLQLDNIPAHCNLCDFYRCGIPCPLHNQLRDGSPVCTSHKYVILKHA